MKKGDGFTLIELLVVMTILVIFFALAGVGMRKVKTKADDLACLKNLKDIHTATMLFGEHHGRLPTNWKNLIGDVSIAHCPNIEGLEISEPWDQYVGWYPTFEIYVSTNQLRDLDDRAFILYFEHENCHSSKHSTYGNTIFANGKGFQMRPSQRAELGELDFYNHSDPEYDSNPKDFIPFVIPRNYADLNPISIPVPGIGIIPPSPTVAAGAGSGSDPDPDPDPDTDPDTSTGGLPGMLYVSTSLAGSLAGTGVINYGEYDPFHDLDLVFPAPLVTLGVDVGDGMITSVNQAFNEQGNASWEAAIEAQTGRT